MKNKLHIVFICNEYPPGKVGGVGVFTKKLAEGLAKIGHDISVIGLYSEINIKKEEIINNVKITRYPIKKNWIAIFSNRVTLYKHLKKLSLVKPIDIIESPDFEAPIAYIPKLAKKTVTRLHGSHTYFSHELDIKPSRSIKHLEKKQLKNSNNIISVSKYTANKTQSLFSLSKEPYIIYNSVEIDNFSKSIKKNYKTLKKVIYFGTLAEKKGIFPLVIAWEKFNKKNPDWTLTVIGKDAYENGTSNKDKMLNLLGETQISVNFITHIENEKLINSLKDYDFAILPSFSEAFALAPLEAMATGLPVIISNMSSGPELINDGIDGLLCDPRQQETLLKALNELASSEILRKEVAEKALIKINSFYDFNSFMKNNLDFYKKILSK